MEKQKENLNQKLIGPVELLKSSFGVYKSKFWILVEIMVFPVILNLILAFTQSNISQSDQLNSMLVFKTILVFFVGIISILISTWAYLAIILVNKNPKLTVTEAYRKSLNILPSYIYINILVAIATIPGFLLLGIPAIIYMVWFSFAAFVFVYEGHNGPNALMRSREYVIHRWWRVAGRAFFIILILLLAQILGSILNNSIIYFLRVWKDFAEFIQVIIPNLIVVLSVPLSICYTNVLYTNLKETRPELAKQPVNEKYKWFFIFSPTTILVFVLLLLGLLIKVVKGI